MHSFQDFIENEILSVTYMGVSDDVITHQLIGIANSIVDDRPALMKLSKKASLLIAESFQNVVRHGSNSDNPTKADLEADFFQMTILKDRILLSSKNLILNEHVDALADKIRHINQLSKEELKKLWMDCMKEGKLSDKGGAGLGIIEMGRKTNVPLRVQFVSLDNKYSRFYLGLELQGKNASPFPELSLVDIISRHINSKRNNLLLEYKGDFSAETNPKIIGMLHSNLINEGAIDSKAVEQITMLIEVIQNISKHGVSDGAFQKGQIAVYRVKKGLKLKSSNLIKQNEVKTLSEFVEQLKNCSREDLLKLRKSKLKEKLTDEGDGGLGLIEIALYSKQNFNITLEPLNDLHSIFSIELILHAYD